MQSQNSFFVQKMISRFHNLKVIFYFNKPKEQSGNFHIYGDAKGNYGVQKEIPHLKTTFISPTPLTITTRMYWKHI